jgi:hypothetical protein
MENIQESTTRSWLQRLKEESWEAELLVSAVAIFAILKSFAALDWLIFTFIDNLNPSQYDIGYMILVFGYLAIGILCAMFAIHFAFRAYWIGLVGLNSVFPDYGLEDSAYSPIYTKKILNALPKINDSIAKIDELCSVIFSAAFAFMMIYLYATITASLYLILFNILRDFIPTWILFAPLALLAISFVFGFLISIPANMKKYRNNEKIQHLYFLYARWSMLPLYGPFYKSIMQITMLFGSNFKKKKGLIKMVLLMLFIGILFGGSKLIGSNYRYLINKDIQPDKSRVYANYYSTNNSDLNFLLAPEIQTEIISDNTLKLFVPILEHETRIMGKSCELEGKKLNTHNSERQNRWKKNLDCYAANVFIELDAKPIQIDFLKTDHYNTEQFGLSGFVTIKELAAGTHQLKIVKKISSDMEKSWTIPFYYSPQ